MPVGENWHPCRPRRRCLPHQSRQLCLRRALQPRHLHSAATQHPRHSDVPTPTPTPAPAPGTARGGDPYGTDPSQHQCHYPWTWCRCLHRRPARDCHGHCLPAMTGTTRSKEHQHPRCSSAACAEVTPGGSLQFILYESYSDEGEYRKSQIYPSVVRRTILWLTTVLAHGPFLGATLNPA